MAKLIEIKGDVTNPQRQEEDIIVIPHCCNNLKKMGAGVALAIKQKWPKVFDVYSNASSNLGTVSYVKVEDDIVIANIIGQKGFIGRNNPKPIKYTALMRAMIDIKEKCLFNMEKKGIKVSIHTPEFGGKRAGGNFNFIKELIQEIWVDNGIDVVIYQFEEK